jgi:protein-disulfide isomerase
MPTTSDEGPMPVVSARRRFRGDLVTTLGIWVAIVVVIWVNWPQPPPLPRGLPTVPVALEPVTVQGDPAARLILLVFSDYQCPYCRQFALETEPLLEDRYVNTRRIRLGYRHLPIDKIHPLARGASVAVECAGRQDRFWQMHRRLFEQPEQLHNAALRAHAEQLGLDPTAFEQCLSDETVAARVDADVSIARSFRITGTPALVVGRMTGDGQIQYVAALKGAVPFGKLSETLDAELRWAWFARYGWSLAAVAGLALGLGLLLLRRRRRRILAS